MRGLVVSMLAIVMQGWRLAMFVKPPVTEAPLDLTPDAQKPPSRVLLGGGDTRRGL